MKAISEWLVIFFVLVMPVVIVDCIRFPDEEVSTKNKNEPSNNDRRNQLIFKEDSRIRFPDSINYFDLHSSSNQGK